MKREVDMGYRGLRRHLSQYAGSEPRVIADQASPAAQFHWISDAKHDIAVLSDALRAILFQVRQGKVLERDACIAQAEAALQVSTRKDERA